MRTRRRVGVSVRAERPLSVKACGIGSEGAEALTYRTGRSTVNVYRSDFAGTNKATALTWTVDDVDGVVRALKSKGVRLSITICPRRSTKETFTSSGN